MMLPTLNVNSIRQYFIYALDREEYVLDKTGVKTIEVVGAQFIADAPAIFGTVNEKYIQQELEWYKSMSRNIWDMPAPVPEIWKRVATKDGWINSNYGWCIWHGDNNHQYHNCLAQLKADKNSRRAIMIYTRPSMQEEYNENGMSDFMCTNTVQYLVRNGELYAIVNMRSNDVWAGYRNDKAWQDYVHQSLAADLGVEVGPMIWSAGSLHCYERDFWRIDCHKRFDKDMSKADYETLIK